MTDYRSKIDEQRGGRVQFELYQFARKSHALSMALHGSDASTAGTTPSVHLHPPHSVTARQLRIVLDGGAALLEPGALQYARGRLQVEGQKSAGAGGLFSRAITSAGGGESAFATRYSGQGRSGPKRRRSTSF